MTLVKNTKEKKNQNIRPLNKLMQAEKRTIKAKFLPHSKREEKKKNETNYAHEIPDTISIIIGWIFFSLRFKLARTLNYVPLFLRPKKPSSH